MNKLKHWILDAEGNHVKVDLLTWAQWLEHPDNRVICYTQITSRVWVSTIFLGIDHRFPGYPPGPPILYETLVFNGPMDGEGGRWCSRDDAETGHKTFVKKAREAAGQRITKDADEKPAPA